MPADAGPRAHVVDGRVAPFKSVPFPAPESRGAPRHPQRAAPGARLHPETQLHPAAVLLAFYLARGLGEQGAGGQESS